MDIIDLNNLKEISEQKDGDKLNVLFHNIIENLKMHLNLDKINSNIKIIFSKNNFEGNFKGDKILDLGVQRIIENDIYTIEITGHLKNFLPFIFLREAYLCFIPNTLKQNKIIKFIINSLVEIKLSNYKYINEWKLLIREEIHDEIFEDTDFMRLEKLLKYHDIRTDESVIGLFFDYIRKNILLISDLTNDFHEVFLKDFILKTSKLLYDDEIIETLRILIKIFYKERSYRALLDYQNLFKSLKESGEIESDLSLRKFTYNVKWLHNFSFIAPTYNINFDAYGTNSIKFFFKFHPLLSRDKINRVLERFPFCFLTKSSENNFAIKVSGYFIIPSVYLNDLRNLIQKLEQYGYIIDKTILNYPPNLNQNHLNLNYFRVFYKKGRLINPSHRDYDNKYEITWKSICNRPENIEKLPYLTYLIFMRAFFWSPVGFSFEQRRDLLRTLKKDILTETLLQRKAIKRLKSNLQTIHGNFFVKNQFLEFLSRNQHYGSVYIKEFLENLLKCWRFIKRKLKKTPSLKDPYQILKFIKQYGISSNLDENLALNSQDMKKIIFHNFIPLFLQNKKKLEIELQTYEIYSKFFGNCFRLKIFDLRAIKKIILEENLAKKIFNVKERKLQDIYNAQRLKELTISEVNVEIDSLINASPCKLQPLLINSINTTNFAKYIISMVLKDSPENYDVILKLKPYIPRILNVSGIDDLTKERVMSIDLNIPNMKEKEYFVSCLFNLFQGNILKLNRYVDDGIYEGLELNEYYDFESQTFFYTSDLYEQYFKYIVMIFGSKLKKFEENGIGTQQIFWSKEKNINSLVKKIEYQKSKEIPDFNLIKIKDLLLFNLNLESSLKNLEKLKEAKQQEFYKRYISAIKFTPSFQKFGFSQYYLYIRPININEIDFKLLFTNSFQKVKYLASIDNTNSLFIQFLFPYRTPNTKYLNWLLKSKKNVSEYCLYNVKKIYYICHFDYNLTKDGWDLNHSQFQSFAQKILFDPTFRSQISEPKHFSIEIPEKSEMYAKDSQEFRDLTNIYSIKSVDIKSILGTTQHKLSKIIKELIRRRLIFPYLKLKNLNFEEKIMIIVPNIDKSAIPILLKIFSFFNYGFIYDIEGEYFIWGFDQVKTFSHGLMIKLYLPEYELKNFHRTFDKIFQYLKIEKYLVINNMIHGNNLLKEVYGDLKFMEEYNPLTNLKWNKKDKIWMNHKLFTEKFEPIYPDLLFKESRVSEN